MEQNEAVRLLVAGQVSEAVTILERIVMARRAVDASKRDERWAAGLGVALENLAAARRRMGDDAGAAESQRAAVDVYLQVCAASGNSMFIQFEFDMLRV